MDRKPTQIVIEGIEEIIKRDLLKHKSILDLTQLELLAFREARSHEIKKKKHYSSLIGSGKFDDGALQSSMNDIAINIRHLSDKAELAEEKIKHHTLIVDTLTEQLAEQYKGLADLAESRRDDGSDN